MNHSQIDAVDKRTRNKQIEWLSQRFFDKFWEQRKIWDRKGREEEVQKDRRRSLRADNHREEALEK